MALKSDVFSSNTLSTTKDKMEGFLSDKNRLKETRDWLQKCEDSSFVPTASEEQMKVLKCFEKTFSCYLIEDEKAIKIKQETNNLEAELESQRNKMELGKVVNGVFHPMSSTLLRSEMRTSKNESDRKVVCLHYFCCSKIFIGLFQRITMCWRFCLSTWIP